MRSLGAPLLIMFALSSCTTATPILPVPAATVPMRTTFDPSEVAFFNETGTNSVKGSAFIRQQGGGVVSCAGNEVYLIPQGTYSTERMGIIYGKTSSAGFNLAGWRGRQMPVPPVDAYRSHQRETTCDIDGKFEFRNIAAGSYFVVTRVTWTISHSTQGGSLMAPITFADNNEVKSVVLSPRDSGASDPAL